MSILIYKNQQQEGPYDLATIQQGLSDGRFDPDDFAWQEGAADWVALRTLFPTIIQPPKVIPAIQNQIQTPQSKWSKAELIEVAKRQKSIIWMLLISLVATFIPFATIITGIIMVYYIYKLAIAVHSRSAWCYIVLAFFPLFGIIALLHLNSIATKTLQNSGINVGLMGASLKDII